MLCMRFLQVELKEKQIWKQKLKRNRIIIPRELTSEEGFGSGMWMWIEGRTVATLGVSFGESSEEEEESDTSISSSSHGNGLFISTNKQTNKPFFLPSCSTCKLSLS